MENNNNQEKPEKKGGNWKIVWELLQIAIIAIVIVVPIRYFLFQPFIVSGDSMVPTFHSGDYLIVDEISYRFSTPQRGDVIVFDFPLQPSERFIKRVIGLPGETVTVQNGQVSIVKDGKTTILSEKYLPKDLKTYGDVTTTLKPGQYFVLGDNREYSYDSRAWGVVPTKNIIGKAFLRIFPLAALTEFSHQTY